MRNTTAPKRFVPSISTTSSSSSTASSCDESQRGCSEGPWESSVGGIRVRFPYRAPYGVQSILMYRCITAASERKNALLESPTGTGKTLALLCSSLAWLEQQRELESQEATTAANDGREEEEGYEAVESQHATKTSRSRVFYCTRTHSQVKQVVSELRRTSYRPKLAVLASRDHLCVHPQISRLPSQSKSHECKKLLENPEVGCRFKRRVDLLRNHGPLQPGGRREVWDVEDLAELAKETKACAYFAARALAQDAELILCPYNYLIDPAVRESLAIRLEGALVIIDEAHNIEDSCRSAASFEAQIDHLEGTLAQLQSLSGLQSGHVGSSTVALEPLISTLQRLLDWLQRATAELQPHDFEQHRNVWKDDALFHVLNEVGITAQSLPGLQSTVKSIVSSYYSSIVQAEESQDEKGKEEADDEAGAGLLGAASTLTASSAVVLEGLFRTLEGLFANEYQHFSAFRLVIAKEFIRDSAGISAGYWSHCLYLWCLSPAVAFSPIVSAARSVVLTSGTLSPMDGFEAELGALFPLRYEAKHVIDVSKQLWAGSISRINKTAPLLNGSFKNTDTLVYQDHVGECLVECCKVIPHGVLCFFPSYGLMEKLCARWQQTGLWRRLAGTKSIVLEPKGGGEEFSSAMSSYCRAVNQSVRQQTSGKRVKTSTSSTRKTGVGGGLFMAVCRGKVSEGLDFKDENARAVIVISIPFPSLKSLEVTLKRQFNEETHLNRNGNQWYVTQAWRALNQAVGRCIRHVNDYGAIILIDERFSAPTNNSKLSKWLAGSVRPFQDLSESASSLQQFFQSHQEGDPSTKS